MKIKLAIIITAIIAAAATAPATGCAQNILAKNGDISAAQAQPALMFLEGILWTESLRTS